MICDYGCGQPATHEFKSGKRFPYHDNDGKLRHYTPDFWVEEWNTYVEVKGYETELDRIKWSQFKENLQVWKRDRILPIMEGGQAGNAADC